MCPRAIRRRSASRTSGSHRERSPGSLMLGEKKRWLTVLSSTLTREPPTTPSAAPKPVMLRIMNSRASYELATTLSIEEVPAHAVVVRQSRHLEPGHDGVDLAENISILPRDRRVIEPQLEQSRHRLVLRREVGRGRRLAREPHLGTVLVSHRQEDVEIPLRKLAQPARIEKQLAPYLGARQI